MKENSCVLVGANFGPDGAEVFHVTAYVEPEGNGWRYFCVLFEKTGYARSALKRQYNGRVIAPSRDEAVKRSVAFQARKEHELRKQL